MSYILDALRKSEQERQVAAGRGTGMLFPVAAETRPGVGRKVILFGAVTLILTLLLNGWSWWRLSSTPANSSQSARPTQPLAAVQNALPAPPVPKPATISTPAATAPAAALPPMPRQAVEPPAAITAAQPTERKPTAAITPKPAALADKPVKSSTPEPAPPATARAPRNETASESPKGLPSISVSGFIRDEATGNLAIINDKLVREGEEVLPGLRLEKIDGESALLNYKGQRFRR